MTDAAFALLQVLGAFVMIALVIKFIIDIFKRDA